MSRPSVSVVMPFAGDAAAARAAVTALLRLGNGPATSWCSPTIPGVADLESRCHGRARCARSDLRHTPATPGRSRRRATGSCSWTRTAEPRSGLLDAYFDEHVADDVGALAGEVVPVDDTRTLAARYGASRSFLSQEAHLAHPYRPRAVAANLMVRRAAFEQIGGFYEGVRAAEDTDFSWRLQEAGWRIELRPQARVEHTYRATIGELRRQWRGYAAGRAWLARRYAGFEPEPALRRAAVRGWRRLLRRGRAPGRVSPGSRQSAHRTASDDSSGQQAGRLDRGRYFALDALLAADELTGLALSNRPRRSGEDEEARSGRARGRPLPGRRRPVGRVRADARARPRGGRGAAGSGRRQGGPRARDRLPRGRRGRGPRRCARAAQRSPSAAMCTRRAPPRSLARRGCRRSRLLRCVSSTTAARGCTRSAGCKRRQRPGGWLR